MLMQPQGEDMGACNSGVGNLADGGADCDAGALWDFRPKREMSSPYLNAALVIFFPFVIVSLISLSMLYQIDGNYFMLLYSMLILGGMPGDGVF